ncbi:hypothetical protein PYCC9005_005340 [Savitreella phatthalungensis]
MAEDHSAPTPGNSINRPGDDRVKYFVERRSAMPAHYWATLNAPATLSIDTSLDSYKADEVAAAFEKRKCSGDMLKILSPTGRTCASLLSEMLKPQPQTTSVPSSPATTSHELVSDHGSDSTRTTPPMLASPPKRISFGPAPVRTNSNVSSRVTSAAPSRQPSHSEHTHGERHVSFGVPPPVREAPSSCSEADHEKTPVARKISFAIKDSATTDASQSDSTTQSAANGGSSTIAAGEPAPRPRTIKFAASNPPSRTASTDNTSRRPSIDLTIRVPDSVNNCKAGDSTDEATDDAALPTPKPKTCKSAIETVLQKEAVGKVVDPVEEVEEDDENDADIGQDDDEANDDEDNEDDDEEEEDEDEDADEDDDDDLADEPSDLDLDLDSDDDGYQEDIESDDGASVFDDDIFPNLNQSVQTPTRPHFSSEQQVMPLIMPSSPHTTRTVSQPQPPSESDLPDTTDFCAGNMDEDQPACAAFDAACREKAARRRLPKPQDIDPTFPDSGTDSEAEVESKQKLRGPTTMKKGLMADEVAGATAIRAPRSPRMWSPPLAARRNMDKTSRSLPRRHGHGNTSRFPPKPCRAMMIKQSNEQRAQRRRERKERRQAARDARRCIKAERNPQLNPRRPPVDHTGHVKMQAIGTKQKLTQAKDKNPCEFRPVMSI